MADIAYEYCLNNMNGINSGVKSVSDTFKVYQETKGYLELLLRARMALKATNSFIKLILSAPKCFHNHIQCRKCFIEAGKEINDIADGILQSFHEIEKIIDEEIRGNSVFYVWYQILLKKIFKKTLNNMEDLDALIKSYQGTDGKYITAEELLKSINA